MPARTAKNRFAGNTSRQVFSMRHRTVRRHTATTAGIPIRGLRGDCKRPVTLVRELDGLSTEEQQNLSKSLDDLVKETPQTQVAVTRFKKMLTKVRGMAAEGLKKILIEVATEAVKKQLFGS